MKIKFHYKTGNYFMLRNPAFPLRQYQSNSDYSNALLEGILVASQSLYDSIIDHEKKSVSVDDALTKYRIRSATRSTPFGLFSGVSMGKFSDCSSTLTIYPTDKHHKRARVDMEWLRSLIKKLQEDTSIFPHLKYKFNENCYLKGDRIFNPYMAFSGEHGQNDICSFIRYTKPVSFVKETCHDYRSVQDICNTVIAKNPGQNPEKIIGFIQNLIKNEFLISELRPPLINTDPLYYILSHLKHIPAANHYVIQLNTIQSLLKEYNGSLIGSGIDLYTNLIASMKTIVESENYLQVDMKTNTLDNRVNNIIARRAEKAVDALTRLCPQPETDNLREYKADFLEKYGYNTQVPLLIMLDEDLGIGSPEQYQNPPSRRIGKNTSTDEKERRLQQLLINKMAKHPEEIILTDDDINYVTLSSYELQPYQLPKSIELYCEIIAPTLNDIDKDNFSLCISGCCSSQGASKSFGRFTDLICDGTNFYNELIECETNSLDNNEIMVELHELPTKSRTSNVTINTNPYPYQIAMSTNTCAGKINLSMNDIYIGIDEKNYEFYAISRSLNKKLAIKCSHMLTPYSGSNAYRFLRDISIHCRANITEVIMQMNIQGVSHMPRIVYDQTILRPEQWILDKEELSKIDSDHLLLWKQQNNLPDIVYYVTGDNKLLINLQMKTHISLLLQYLKVTGKIMLSEFLHNPNATALKDVDHNSYLNELVIPLYLDNKIQTNNSSPHLPKSLITLTTPRQSYWEDDKRILFPGEDDWVYIKVYGFNNRIEEFLGEELLGKVMELSQNKLIDKHFFIRYSDPELHFRIRFHRHQQTSISHLISELFKWTTHLKSAGFATRIQFDTYERELERYGGKSIIHIAESYFEADSIAVEFLMHAKRSGVLSMSDDLIGLYAYIYTMKTFGLNLHDIFSWIGLSDDTPLYKKECKKNREKYLRIMMLEDADCSPEEEAIKTIFANRMPALARYRQAIEGIDTKNQLTCDKDSILRAIIHMFCNRFTANNSWERKIYCITEYSAHAYSGYLKHRKAAEYEK